jgi:hypothetical protein
MKDCKFELTDLSARRLVAVYQLAVFCFAIFLGIFLGRRRGSDMMMNIIQKCRRFRFG